MAASLVAVRGTGTDALAGATTTATTSGTISAGNKVVLAVANQSGSASPSSVSGGGLTWTRVATPAQRANATFVFFVADAPSGLASGTSITINWSASGDNRRVWEFQEWTGVATGAPAAGQIASNTGSSNAPSAGSPATAAASGDGVIAGFSVNGNIAAGSWTVGTGYTKRTTQAVGAVTQQTLLSETKIGAGASVTGDCSIAPTTAAWAAMTIILSAAAPPPVGTGLASGNPPPVTEIAFGTTPADPNPVWTNVSAYVEEIHTHRGRTNPLEDVNAGTCTYLLDNRDRRFEPLYAAGPYYPNVKPLKRIRSYAIENPITDPDFESKNAAGAWVIDSSSSGTISVPAYGTVAAKFGDWVLGYTINALDIGAAAGVGFIQTAITPRAAFSTAEAWVASIYVRTSRNNTGAILKVYANGGAHARALLSNTSTVALSNTGWTRISVMFTPDYSDRTTLEFNLVADMFGSATAWQAGDVMYIDGAQMTRGVTNAIPWAKTLDIFDGYVEGWPQQWAGGMQAEVEVDCVDGFKPAAKMQVVRGSYDLVVLDDTPTWYFRLGEALSTQSATNEVAPNIQDGTYSIVSSSPSLAQAQTYLVGDPDYRVKFTGGLGDVHRNTVVIPTSKFAVEFICQFADPTTSGGTQHLFSHGDSTGGVGTVIGVTFDWITSGSGVPYTGYHMSLLVQYGGSGNVIQVFIQNPANTNAYWADAHLISISWDGTGQDGKQGWPQFYFDGVLVDPSSAGNQAYSSACLTKLGSSGNISKPYVGKVTNAGLSRTLYIGNDYTGLFGLPSPGVYVDEVAYWVDKIPSSGWALRHKNAWVYGAAVEDAGARAGHLLDQANVSGNNPWPAARRRLDTGVSQVQGFRWNEQQLIDLLKQDAKSEGGIFFFGADGAAVFQNRWHNVQYPYTMPKGYLSDQPDPSSSPPLAPYADIGGGGLDYDDHDIYNDVRISRFLAGYGDASGTQQATDATSITDYMISTLQLDDSIVTTDIEALNQAYWYLYLFKNPGLKAKTLKIEPLMDEDNLWRIVSMTDLNDRLNVVRHPPPGTGTAMNFDVLVQAINHDIVKGEWHVEYTIYPGPAREFWQLPDSATNDEYAQFSVLGTTTRLTY